MPLLQLKGFLEPNGLFAVGLFIFKLEFYGTYYERWL